MKKVNFLVEFGTELEDDVDPNDVTFDIPIELVHAQDYSGKNVGRLVAYCTQSDPEVIEESCNSDSSASQSTSPPTTGHDSSSPGESDTPTKKE